MDRPPPPRDEDIFFISSMCFGWGENPHFFHLKPIGGHYVYIYIWHQAKLHALLHYREKSIHLHCEQDCEWSPKEMGNWMIPAHPKISSSGGWCLKCLPESYYINPKCAQWSKVNFWWCTIWPLNQIQGANFCSSFLYNLRPIQLVWSCVSFLNCDVYFDDFSYIHIELRFLIDFNCIIILNYANWINKNSSFVHPCKLTARPWKRVLGRQAFPLRGTDQLFNFRSVQDQLTWLAGKWTRIELSRCISYWKWWFSSQGC